jgi:hypothetical protein
LKPKIPAKNCGCRRVTMTSTALPLPALGPLAGGWLTVTVTPLCPSVNPFELASA